MALPNQNIPEREKTTEWIQGCVRAIRQQVDSYSWQRDRDVQCRMLWNAENEDYKYDYLRKYGEYEMPAFVRFIPILRPKGERLMGEYTERPFQYTIFSIDDSTLETVMDQMHHGLIESLRAKIFDRFGNLQDQRGQVEQMLSQYQQSQQQAVQGQLNGNGQMIEPAQGQMQTVIGPDQARQLKTYHSILQNQELLTEQELRKIQSMHGYNSLQWHELLMTGGLEYMRYTQAIEKKFYDGFENKLITDKALFMVDWDSPYEDPYIHNVNSDSFYYAADNEIDFTQEADWQCFDQYMSVGNVINKWRYEISDDIRDRLEAKRSRYASSFHTTYNGRPVASGSGVYTFGPDVMSNCRVTRVFFRSPRAVHWKKTPNKHLPGEYHEHLIDETDLPAPDQRKADDIYETFYLDDIYEGTLIDDDVFLRCRRKPIVLRSKKHYGKVSLPVIGLAYLSKNRKPYSRMWATKDLQHLYNLMHYHTELYMATSGPRGSIMDKSQKPDGMSDTEWMYQKKLGTMWIQSFKNGRSYAFNQFKTYDDSVGESIVYVEKIKESLDDMASRVWGVSPQRQGEVSPQEKVGTMERSIRMSTLTTEPIYWEMELVKRMALERLVNLSRLAWRKGRRGAYVDDKMNRHILNIPPGAMLDAEYGLYIKDGGREMKLLDSIRNLSVQSKAAGQMSFSQMISVFTTDSVIKLEGLAREFEDEQMKISQQMREAETATEERKMQIQAQIEERLQQLEAELKKEVQRSADQLKDVQSQVQQANMKLAEDKAAFEKQVKMLEMQQASEKTSADTQVKMADIESERFTEFAYLDEQRRQFDIEHGLEQNKDAEKKTKKLEQNMKGSSAAGGDKNPANEGRTSTKNSSKEKIK